MHHLPKGRKMVDGKISLNNAIARLSKNEYYTFVTYQEGDILPKEYIPYEKLDFEIAYNIEDMILILLFISAFINETM